MSHTPAPWKRVDKRGWSGFETPDGDDLLLYATCDGLGSNDWHGRIAFDNPEDAFLVEASPDLYAACEAVHARLDYLQNLWGAEGVTRTLIDTLNAALRKARGETT